MKLLSGARGAYRATSALVGATLALWLALCGAVFAAEPALELHTGSVERAQVGRAAELLDAAVAYLKHNGPEQAFAAFDSQTPTFHYGAYYV